MPDALRDLALLKTLDHAENPQPRPANRVQIQNNLPANVHVMIHGKMNSKREPLLPDIDDAYNANDLNVIKLTIISPEVRDHNNAGGFLAASNGKQQQQDECITSDINKILGSLDSIEIPQTQCLLNQISHENNMTTETTHIQNSLPDLDSKKLKFEADKALSSLLLDGELRNEISEQHDSGIRTSSENTNLYDKSPEKRRAPRTSNCLDDEDALENTSCLCSNLSSPKRKNSTTSDSSYVCSMKSVKTVASLDHSIGVHNLHAANNEANVTKHIPRISSNFDGTNEEFVSAMYGNGQISSMSQSMDEERAVRSQRHRYVKGNEEQRC
ncbi:hypothetical protein K0M31_016094 [Melipona bicolor]|uniref:Uncharacterized protein n=1 Tax=Melipona bicolor TaxID=60889 RepID=A0AA40KTC6_9HYME|nr:hypothetical protein K0M31_016094 [Melipona bicolor]